MGLVSFHLAEFSRDFLLIRRDPLLHRVVHLQRLLQAEDMIVPPSVRSTVPQFPAVFCYNVGRAASPASAHPVRLRRWRAGWPFPSLHRCRKPLGARARSFDRDSFAFAAASLHSPPPGSPYLAPTSAACTPLPRAGTNLAANRNCAAVGSTRNQSGPIFCPVPALAPAAGYPPAALANLALPAPRAGQSNTHLCFPSPPTRPAVLSATPPCLSVLRSLPQSWLLPDRFHPGLEAGDRLFNPVPAGGRADFWDTIARNCFLPSHDSVTCRRSPEVSSTAFHAQPPDLPPVSLMDMGFAIMGSLATVGLLSG